MFRLLNGMGKKYVDLNAEDHKDNPSMHLVRQQKEHIIKTERQHVIRSIEYY